MASSNPAGTAVNRNEAGGSRSGKTNLKASGTRSDVAWQHGVSVDGDARKIKCKYCEKVITGGVYRMKHHLAGTAKDVGACRSVPDTVRKEMWDIVTSLQKRLINKSSQNEHEGGGAADEDGKRKREETSADLFKKRGVSSQPTINSVFKKSLREEACLEIGRFIYRNAIPFNVVKSDEFRKMFELVARHGIGFKSPSYHEIRVKYLKQEVDLTGKSLEDHKAFWKKAGCTIMTDGWTDKRKRTILNFLVNSPKGTVFLKSVDASNITKTADKIFRMMDEVVEEVGVENVVQIVTDNAANYKAAGDLLMQKREKLYWTPCAAHCIDLMLEDFEKKIPVHKETIASGKKLMVDGDEKPAMGFIYEGMDRAKEMI